MAASAVDFFIVGVLYISCLSLVVKACAPTTTTPVPSTSSSSSTSTSTSTSLAACSFASSLDADRFMDFNGTCSNGQCTVLSGSSFMVQGSVCGNDGLQISTSGQANQQVIAPGVVLFTCTDGALVPSGNGVSLVGNDVTTIDCFPSCSVTCDPTGGAGADCPFDFPAGPIDATCPGNTCTISDDGSTRFDLGEPGAAQPLCDPGDNAVFTVIDANGQQSQIIATTAITAGGPPERVVLFCRDGYLTGSYQTGGPTPDQAIPGDIISIGCQQANDVISFLNVKCPGFCGPGNQFAIVSSALGFKPVKTGHYKFQNR